MKLPFELGVKLLYRLLLPGFIFTLGLSPFIFSILDWINWPESHVYFLLATVIVAGWLILILDMPIYMAFEGRRYWFSSLRKCLVKCETKRLENLDKNSKLSVIEEIEAREEQLKSETDQVKKKELQQQIDRDERKYLEALFDIRNFPMNDKGEYRATFPTRLGNLIDAFENYSERVYGMDTVFYWPRLWLKLDKDVKEDIDNRQAIADSTIYVAFVCYVNAAIWIVFGLLASLNTLILWARPEPVFIVRHTLFEHLPRWWLVSLISLAFFLAGFLLYRLSFRLHAQFGEVFKSVFDVFHEQINVSKVMADIADYANDYSFLLLPPKQRFKMARSYLQFGLIRCPCCRKRIAAAAMKDHLAGHQRLVTTVQNSTGDITDGN